jgi:hypothetical protein
MSCVSAIHDPGSMLRHIVYMSWEPGEPDVAAISISDASAESSGARSCGALAYSAPISFPDIDHV